MCCLSLSFNFMASVTAHMTLEPKKVKSDTLSNFLLSIYREVMGLDATIYIFWMLSYKPAFSLCSFTLIRGSFVPLCFLPLGWYHVHIWGYWYFSRQSSFQLGLHVVWHFHDILNEISRVTIYSLDILFSYISFCYMFCICYTYLDTTSGCQMLISINKILIMN